MNKVLYFKESYGTHCWISKKLLATKKTNLDAYNDLYAIKGIENILPYKLRKPYVLDGERIIQINIFDTINERYVY